MSEKLLLLSEARSPVLLKPRKRHVLRYAAIAVGLFVIFVGAFDVVRRAESLVSGSVLFTAFAPAITIFEPTLLPQPGVVQGTSTASLTPVRLKIPTLGVDARVVPVRNKADGSMDTPKKFNEIAWYEPGPRVGEPGNAVFAGHVNNALTTAGVFAHLSEIKRGDQVILTDSGGKERTYRVTDIANYPVDAAPLEVVFSKYGSSQVALITCDGDWDAAERQFERRLVVFAKPTL